MKVVLDTNVIVSGIFWKGNPNRILLAWRAGKFELFVSVEILDEFVRILNSFEVSMPKEMIAEWIKLIVENSSIVEPIERFDVASDKKDNKFIDCVIAAKADFLVSGDKDLLDLKEFKGVKIVKPTKFVKILNKP